MSQAIMDSYYDSFARRLEEQEKVHKEMAAGTYRPRFVRIVQKRLSRDKDARMTIAGEGGCGKSTLALVLGERLNPSLYIDKYQEAVDVAVCFSGKQYLAGVRTLPSLYPGSPDPLERTVLDYDEPAQSWYHRQFMTEANQILAKTMIGYRYKKFVTPLSVPNVDLLDVDALRLMNWFIWVSEQGIAEVYRVMVQKFGGLPWYKTVINTLRFPKPHAKLWHAYEKKKFAEQDRLHEQYGRKMEEVEESKLSRREIIDLIKKGIDQKGQPKDYYQNGRLHVPTVQAEFEIGINAGYMIKAKIESEKAGKREEQGPLADDLSAEDLLREVVE